MYYFKTKQDKRLIFVLLMYKDKSFVINLTLECYQEKSMN